jgi:predicted phage tail protein
MSEKIRTVRLYGKLGAQFGRVHRFVVSNPVQAVRALRAMVPGFERELMSSKDRGVTYAVFVGTRNLAPAQLAHPVGDDDIRIAPVLLGSKNAGLIQTIAGIAIVAAASYFSGGLAAGGASLFGGSTGAAIGGIGVSLALGGIMQMISPTQRGLASSSASNGTSYNFNGPVNTQAQGNPVPVLYGRLVVGSAVISAGITAEDI